MCGLRTGKNSEKSRQEGSNEEKIPTKRSERYIGDGLTLKMELNERDIEVTGDGCRLTMAINRGRIRINGDGCRLTIERNTGDIEYRGDGGRVSLGPDSTGTKVQYFGEGGRVNIAENADSTRITSLSVSGAAAASRKNHPRNLEDFVDNILTDKRPRRIIRTTGETVRIVYGNPKIVSLMRKKNSNTCTVAS